MENNRSLEFFLGDITSSIFGGGYIEVVSNFTQSRYFGRDHFEELADYAIAQAEAGNEVHFGPFLRKEDLGSIRSDSSNLLMSNCLWVDIDCPDKGIPAEQRLAKAKELLDKFLEILELYNLTPSWIICSGNGYHVYFRIGQILLAEHALDLFNQAQTALVQAAKADIQAKDPTRLLRLPFTFNYKDRDNPKMVIIEISNGGHRHLIEDFKELVRDFGKPLPENFTPTEVKPVGFTPPCIAHLLDPLTDVVKGSRHLARNIVATFAHQEDWPVDEVIEKVQHFTDDPKKSENDIRRIYKILDYDPTRYSVGCGSGSKLESLVKAGVTVCDKDNCGFGKPPVDIKAAKKEDEPEFLAYFNGLIDLVLDDQDKVAYMVKENGNLVLIYEREENGKKYVPPTREHIKWLLPKATAVLSHYQNDTDAQLFNDLVVFHISISEMPDAHHYKILAAYDMHTYLMEKFEYSPVIWLYAIPERGKTRTGKAIMYVSYRGWHTITVREAHIIRFAQNVRGTLFIDVSDLWNKVERESAEDIFLNRFENGATVCRIKDPSLGPFKDTIYYQVYGPTIAATNEMVNDVMASRTVQIIMPQSSRSFEDDVKPEHGLPFRERLVAFRARWIDKDLPSVDKPCNGRLGDILKPIRNIVNMVGNDELWFLDFVIGVEERRKQSSSDSFDAQVLSAMKDAMNAITNSHLLNEDILAKFNLNRSERERITPQKLGRTTAAFGFKKYTSGQQRGIVWDEQLFVRLCQRYGVDYTSYII